MTGERFLCFISGIAIGITAALLSAPKSGREMRAVLRDSASEGADFLNRKRGEVEKTITENVQRGKQAAEVTSDGIVAAVEEGKAILVG
jgi:gas vesicle protein